jgi:DNA (cytosine-5)-methyltransferase 1
MKNKQVKIEEFSETTSHIKRGVLKRDGTRVFTTIAKNYTNKLNLDLASAFDYEWLRLKSKPETNASTGHVRVVDLFSGAGGFSIGITEACRALGLSHQSVFANDIDEKILDIYSLNFPEAKCIATPIENILDRNCGEPFSKIETQLQKDIGQIDILVGGPPCQGHSDLNNHTRREDPKNELYLKMARFCELIRPRHVIIENVPGVLHDKKQVAQRTWAKLKEMGYKVDSGVINAHEIGVAQNRKRSITIASLDVEVNIEDYRIDSNINARDISWAIRDLTKIKPKTILDTPPTLSPENTVRIDYLFDNNLFDLPDSERPDCHRLKKHTYKSVYGRLNWELPSPTLTTGFGVPGRGRYIHPGSRRAITLHEGARIQYFPDFFQFPVKSRTLVQKVIGNAIPSRLGYTLALHLLR